MERFFNREFTFDRVARTLLLALVVLLLVLGLRAIWDVLLPFLLAGIFAYVMMPLVRFFQFKLRLRSRGLAVILTLLVMGALIYLAVIYVVPSVREEVEKTLQMISSYRISSLCYCPRTSVTTLRATRLGVTSLATSL